MNVTNFLNESNEVLVIDKIRFAEEFVRMIFVFTVIIRIFLKFNALSAFYTVAGCSHFKKTCC